MKIHPIFVYCGFKTALNQETHYLFEIDLLAQILIFQKSVKKGCAHEKFPLEDLNFFFIQQDVFKVKPEMTKVAKYEKKKVERICFLGGNQGLRTCLRDLRPYIIHFCNQR